MENSLSSVLSVVQPFFICFVAFREYLKNIIIVKFLGPDFQRHIPVSVPRLAFGLQAKNFEREFCCTVQVTIKKAENKNF